MVHSQYTRVALVVAIAGGVGLGADRYLPTFRPDVKTDTALHVDAGAGIRTHLDRLSEAGTLTPSEHALLTEFYGTSDAAVLWVDERGEMTSAAEQTLDLLRTADRDGLDPAAYLPAMVPSEAGAQTVAEFDTTLTLATLRYLRDIHHGRVAEASAGRVWAAGPRVDDRELLRRLWSAAPTTGVQHLASEVAPQLPEYQRVRAALADYRVRASRAPLPTLPDLDTSVHPGDALPWADVLRTHLVAHGDLTEPQTSPMLATYDDVLVEGVRRFQRRHGLNDDGVIGQGTLQALTVPMAQRVRQLELALERMRWLPSDLDGPTVIVDIPMFRLTARDRVRSATAPALTMRVAVGGSKQHQTPQLVSRMERVVFRPAWNVPRSITSKEILPKLREDAEYLSRNGYELVPTSLNDEADDEDVLDAIARGAFRLRQQPGGGNSLGLIKFDFQNDHAVYLHDTPAKAAFARDRRDVSHGCVRVDDPVALARWLLAADGWADDRIRAAMQGADRQSVAVPRPVTVVLRYVTASVTADGQVLFANDIYGLDRVLEQALRSSGDR
ncbi:MAG: hypothetical protein AMXMBFR57_32240 [Acidimicrobiia bacterium]|jgi:murein L,D-transpeptidase YcbB/YkuD